MAGRDLRATRDSVFYVPWAKNLEDTPGKDVPWGFVKTVGLLGGSVSSFRGSVNGCPVSAESGEPPSPCPVFLSLLDLFAGSCYLDRTRPFPCVLTWRERPDELWRPQFSVSCGLTQFLRCFTDLVMSPVSVLLCSNQWKGYWNHPRLHQSHPPFYQTFHFQSQWSEASGHHPPVWWQRKAFLTFNHHIFPITKLLPRSHHPHHVAAALGIVPFNMKLSELGDTTLQFRSALCWGYHQSQRGEGHRGRWPLMSPDSNHHTAHPRCCPLAAGTGPTAWTIWTGHGLFLHQEHWFNTKKVERHISHFYFLFFLIMRIKIIRQKHGKQMCTRQETGRSADKNQGIERMHHRKHSSTLTSARATMMGTSGGE